MTKKNILIFTALITFCTATETLDIQAEFCGTFSETSYEMDLNTGKRKDAKTIEYPKTHKLCTLERELKEEKAKLEYEKNGKERSKLEKKIRKKEGTIESEKERIRFLYKKHAESGMSMDALYKKINSKSKLRRAGKAIGIAASFLGAIGVGVATGGMGWLAASLGGLAWGATGLALQKNIEKFIETKKALLHLGEWEDIKEKPDWFRNIKTGREYLKIDKMKEIEGKIEKARAERIAQGKTQASSNEEKAWKALALVKILVSEIQDGIRLKNPKISDTEFIKKTLEEIRKQTIIKASIDVAILAISAIPVFGAIVKEASKQTGIILAKKTTEGATKAAVMEASESIVQSAGKK